ncbi:hypothetical protein L9F63_018437, partial [Diploptera punctata]
MNKWLNYNPHLLSAVSPLFYTSRILGIAPICWPPTGRNRFQLRAYSVLVFFAMLTFLIYSVYWNIQYYYTRSTYTIIVPHIFKMVSSFTTVLAILLLCSTVNKEKYEAIFTKLTTVDSILLKTAENSNVIYKKMKIFVMVQLLVIIPFYLFMFCFDRVVWSGNVGEPHHLVEYFVHLLGTVMDMQFINLVLLIKHRYTVLNRTLMLIHKVPDKEFEWNILLKNKKNVHKTEAIKQIHEVENPIFQKTGIINAKGEVENSFANLKIFPDIEREEAKIIKLQKVHSSLYDVAELVKSCFGLPILFELTFIFGSLIQSLYNSLLTSLQLDNLGTHAGSGEAVGLFLSWSVVRMIKMMCITTSCQMASNEANRTGILIQKLLLGSNGDSKTLRNFSQQLLHYKLNFTACGFFTLDATLLYSLAGAVTTYLVILLQFQFVASSALKVNATNSFA